MKTSLRGYGLILSVSLLAMLCGCGGNTPSSSTAVSHPPVTTVPTWTPAGTSLSEYTLYTFTTSGSDPDIGVAVASYQWTFGDGSAVVTTTAPTVTYAYTSSGNFNLGVAATNTAGVQGAAVTAAVVVASAPSPFTLTAVSPAATSTVQVGLGNTTGVTVTFSVNVADTDGGTIAASGITLSPGDTNAAAPTVGIPVSAGGGLWTIPVTYQPAATTGTRTVNPTVQVVDSLGISSLASTFPTITVNTLVLAAPTTPFITVTSPTSASTSAYSSVPQTVLFTVTDLDGYPVTYSVDWGDGTTPTTGSVTTGTAAGVPITTAIHAYADTYTTAPTVKPATVTITCTDGTLKASPVTLVYNVTYNAYPTATITSPQASGSVPAAVTGLAIPATAPAVVILPLNGMVTFNGSATLPGYELSSGKGTLTYSWSFPGGVPSSFSNTTGASPGQVVFAGTPGKVTEYVVSLTVTDDLARVSSADPTMVSPAATALAFNQTFQRTIVVDGLDSQLFTMSFLYRQRSGTSAADTYTLATTAGHGLGAAVNIYQDGINNSYNVSSANTATTQIPVRSDVGFWLTIPGTVLGDTSDKTTYQFSIPNAPNVDPDLETFGAGVTGTLTPAKKTAFQFQNPGTTVNSVLTGPWNPQLQITTGSGFGIENMPVDTRTFQGAIDLFNNVCSLTGTVVEEPNMRWLDRLSVPTTDVLPTLSFPPVFPATNNVTADFSGILGYQGIPEWFVFLKEVETRDWNTLVNSSNLASYATLTSPSGMGFVIDEGTYIGDTQSSQHWSVSALQAFRAPASTSEPYDFTVMKQSVRGLTDLVDSHNLNVTASGDPDSSAGLNPTPMGLTGLTFMSGLLHTPPTAALSGGLSSITVPYNADSDQDRIPNSPLTYTPFQTRSTFGYAEYLWTNAWARPLVLNRTNLNWADTSVNMTAIPGEAGAPIECAPTAGPTTTVGILSFPWFFYSNPTNPWPSVTNVPPNASAYNLNVVNGGTFDATSPVTENGLTGTTTGVGRFFWTAFTPHYNAVDGAMISRTWLADDTPGNVSQIPVTFTGTATDATTAWGFLPPQDTGVDKRGRGANGLPLSPTTTTGYRIQWYNPTKNAGGTPVSPDFWAVQLVDANSNAQVFLLSGSYPRQTTQAMSNALMTDCRTYIPSNQTTYVAGDTAGPGYCWFDVPLELRPATQTANVTVFALKAILRNNPVPGARALNRSEWVEAVKTVTASISAVPGQASTSTVSNAHKVPFNYPWDIVVVNGPATPVAQTGN